MWELGRLSGSNSFNIDEAAPGQYQQIMAPGQPPVPDLLHRQVLLHLNRLPRSGNMMLLAARVYSSSKDDDSDRFDPVPVLLHNDASILTPTAL